MYHSHTIFIFYSFLILFSYLFLFIKMEVDDTVNYEVIQDQGNTMYHISKIDLEVSSSDSKNISIKRKVNDDIFD